MKPKIKNGVSILYRKMQGRSFEVNFLFSKSDNALPFIFSKTALRIIAVCNGVLDMESIAHKTETSKKEVKKLCLFLEREGVMEISESIVSLPQVMTPQLNFLSAFETPALKRGEMLEKINSAHVIIIGLGGIGTWVAQGLVLGGVRNFVLIDPDKVESSNLNRQCLYNLADVGRYKTVVAAEKLRHSGNDVRIITVRRRIKSCSDINLRWLKTATVVINCGDEPSTDRLNRIVTSVCYPLRIPHILCGGYDGHLGFVGPTIVPRSSPCWFCYEKTLTGSLKSAGYKHLIVNKEEEIGGNIAPICAVVGNIHTLEALKLISGFSSPLLKNRIIEIDFLRLHMNFRGFKKDNSCKVCGSKGKDLL